MFDDFIIRLKDALSGNLPGEEAQIKMAPEERKRMMQKGIPKDVRKGSVLILFYPKNELIYFPLMLRATYEGVHSGQVGFPGGKAEKEDNDKISTALREAHEEVGILPHHVEVLGTLTELYIPPSNFLVTPVVGYAKLQPEFCLDPKECEALIEVDLELFLREYTKETRTVSVTETLRIVAPAFQINNYSVWGATAMMLSELSELIRKNQIVHKNTII